MSRHRDTSESLLGDERVVPFSHLEAKLADAKVYTVEVVGPSEDDSYVRLTFDNGIALYADCPSAYQWPTQIDDEKGGER